MSLLIVDIASAMSLSLSCFLVLGLDRRDVFRFSTLDAKQEVGLGIFHV